MNSIHRILPVVLVLLIGPLAFCADDDNPFLEGPQRAKSGPPKTFADLLQVSSAVEPAEAKRGQTVKLKITLKVAPGYHTYPTTQPPNAVNESAVNEFRFADNPAITWVGKLAEPPPKVHPEKDGKVQHEYVDTVTFERNLVVRPSATPGKTVIKGTATLLVCDDKGCLPPEDVAIEAPLTILDASVPVEAQYAVEVDGSGAPTVGPGTGAGPAPRPAATTQESGLWNFMLTGALWGAISLLTPCVFPMIPITVSFFLKQSEREHHRPFLMALVYSSTIVIVLTLGAVLLLGTFQELSQHWLTNVLLGVLFLVFALSLFGMYELRLPSGLARLTSEQEARGGLIGTVFMALTFTIISFTCVAPFLGGFAGLSASAQSGTDWLRIVLGGLAFAVTFAAPFFVLALFPSLLKLLPRSGAWMNTVKVVMGFLEVAAALKFLRAGELLLFAKAELLTYDLVLGAYVALSLACGLYLMNVYRLPHDSPLEHLGVPRLLFSLAFLSLALYLMPGLVDERPSGAVFAWLDSFVLPDPSEEENAGPAGNGNRGGPGSSQGHAALPWIGNLEKGLRLAKEQNRLIFIDFTGKT